MIDWLYSFILDKPCGPFGAMNQCWIIINFTHGGEF